MLVHTVPDLLRMPEIISFVVIAVIAAGVAMRLFKLRDSRTLFAASLALVQIAVFNQQIVTGASLQPIHYQVFIGNYMAALAVVVTLGMFWQKVPGREGVIARFAVAGLATLAVLWGFVECHYTVRVLDEVNVIRDEALPVARRLAEIAKSVPDPRQYSLYSTSVWRKLMICRRSHHSRSFGPASAYIFRCNNAGEQGAVLPVPLLSGREPQPTSRRYEARGTISSP